MKTRLIIFVIALLLLPYIGMKLSEGVWEDVSGSGVSTTDLAPLLITLLVLLCLLLSTNYWATRRSGNNLLVLQRDYFLLMSVSSCALGWLLVQLNLYTASWITEQALDLPGIIVQSMLFAVLAPAVSSTRALLGSFPDLLKALANGFSWHAPAPQTTTFVLITLVFLGLIGGAAWPAKLFWLYWSSPLLLLVALQLLWNESTIFSNLPHGDFGRVVCSLLSGILVGNLAVSVFKTAGGELSLQIPNFLFAQLGYAWFGLLCLQLGDVIAELWRGRTREQVFKKKTFPIPIVVKK
jgi:hypothetical protein